MKNMRCGKQKRIYDDPKSSQRIKEHNGNKYCC